VSEGADHPESIVGRLFTRLHNRFRRGQPYRGWNPIEPTFMGVAIVLLFATLLLPWWGVSTETFDARRSITRELTIQFSPWLTTQWYSSVAGTAGGFFVLEAKPTLWWDVPREFPAYASYVTVSAVLCAIWSAALTIGMGALWARGAPRRRFSGLPTIAEGTMGALVAAAILVTVFQFPAVDGHGSFAGASSNGALRWGPGLGWYVALAIVVLSFASMVVGFLVDRKLVGVCWFCFRPVDGPRCQHCGSMQRRVSRRLWPTGTTADSPGPREEKP
jgi:hypothetical protein